MTYCDRRLLGRIKQYISEHQHRRVSSDIMAEELQMTYFRDYGRRKRNAFRKLVRETHQTLLQDSKPASQTPLAKRRKPMNGKDRDTGSDSDPEGFMVEYSDTNTLNSSMMSMYKKKQRTSSSAPASPFSYVDCPMVAVDQASVDPGIQENEQNDTNDNNNVKPDYQDTSISNSELPSATKPSGDANLASNVAVSDDFIAAQDLVPKTPQRKSDKKKRQRTKQVQPEDFEITGEKAKPKFNMETPNIKFADVGGNEKTLKEVCNLLLHVKRPEIYKALGVVPPCGVLLHGPPGCGKSLLANAIAGELDVPMLKLAATEIVSGVSGESEEKLRDMFEIAVSSSPCVIFIDEIDAITPKRELASKDMERRIVAQLLACLDDLSKTASQILVIGATNRPDSIDPALRRAGRFDKEISMGIPDEKARADILKVLCKGMKLERDFNYSLLARLTPGYVGADLMSLCQEAATSAVNRIIEPAEVRECAEAEMNVETTQETECDVSEMPCLNRTCDLSSSEFMDWLRRACPLSDAQLESLCIEFSDFENAVATVQPSAKREGFATVPDVTWADIGALENIREELTIAVLAPVRNPEAFSSLGLTKPPGILLAGPPGCGKTLLAKAIASESGINFISVKGPELLNMYVGESERAVRQCFERARNSSPCVVFFDELDSLCPRRSGAESASTSRVVNQMLTEMDGLQTRGNVFVIAATNRPDIIDPAVLRPGRLDKTLYVGLPNSDDRAKILNTLTKNGTKPPISDEVSLEVIASDDRCARFTGADLSSLVREAAVNALREHISIDHVTGRDARIKSDINVTVEHFEKAWAKVKPSVSSKDQLHYEKMRINLEMT